eukprot:TRINITY_DN80736_c0_g1_i1.p1 TRINITY_DN80736_c0_g1~~TRINITY_DN80736_c0_g1_i1.p1  ORF type:complete len:255 (-),score=-2.49 TRINITY_DN80736_c0_g1_i1:309-1025(-)
MDWRAYNIIHRLQPTNYKQTTVPEGPRKSYYKTGEYYTIASLKIARLCQGLLESRSKRILPQLEMSPYSFHRGFIQGFFGADGGINISKYFFTCLTNNNLHNLCSIQRILQRYGIMSQITTANREGIREFQDGRKYATKQVYRLHIHSISQKRFYQLFSFGCKRKHDLLSQLYANQSSRLTYHRSQFTTEFKSSEDMGLQIGYELLGTNRLIEVNGILVVMRNNHLPYQFCNFNRKYI